MARKIYNPEEIQKKFETLPADIQAAVYSADMLNLIQTVGKNHQLHLDQLETLEAETADVMVGFTTPENFVANITESLRIDRAKAELIAKEISEQLFAKIRESMKRSYEAQKQGNSVMISKPTAAIPTPTPIPTPPPAPKIAETHPADAMLTQKSMSNAPTTPAPPTAAPVPKPKNYTVDPYREPTT